MYSIDNNLNADFYRTLYGEKSLTLILMHEFPGSEGDSRGFTNELSASGVNFTVDSATNIPKKKE